MKNKVRKFIDEIIMSSVSFIVDHMLISFNLGSNVQETSHVSPDVY